jgi:hypothetical protein
MRGPPSQEQTILLRSVSTRSRRERSRPEVDRLLGLVDQHRLLQEAALQRLLPVCGARLLEDHGDSLEDSTAQAITDALEQSARTAMVLDGVAKMALKDLERRGIRAVQVKGTALGSRIYGDPGLRAGSDIDLLVGRTQLSEALAALRGHGYREEPWPAVVDGLPDLHYRLTGRRDSWLPSIELHWRLHWYDGGFSRGLLDRSQRDQRGLWCPAPSDELASLLLFFSRDGFIGLRYAADIAAWWDRYSDDLGEHGLSTLAAAYPEIAPSLSAAATVAEELGGPPRRRVLPGSGELRARETRAARQTNWTISGDRDQINANRALVDWLVRPRGGVRHFVRRQLLPPALTVARMYGVSPSARLRPTLLRFVHPVKIVARLAIGRWAIRGDRRWAALPDDAEGELVGIGVEPRGHRQKAHAGRCA